MVVTLRENKFSNPMALMKYIQEQSGTAKVRPDQKIVFISGWQDEERRFKGARQILEKIIELKDEKNQ